MLRLEAADIGYRSRGSEIRIAGPLDLEIDAGEFVCLLGPNGAGKSTLLRTIAGMQPLLAGCLRVDGRDLRELGSLERARLLGVVLTERVTAGMLTSYALVCLGRFPYTGWFGRLSDEDHEIVREAFEAAGAWQFAHRFVSELSDGERQRVMLARALAQRTRLMILDEITAFLDLPRRVEIMSLLQRVAHDTGCVVLLSTHDLDLALRNADRVWLLDAAGQLRSGAPEDLVLSGQLAAAFVDEQIAFDPLKGVLHARARAGVRVDLVGEPSVQREWTERALERCGFRLGDETGSLREERPRIEVLGELGWRLEYAGSSHSCRTIQELSSVLAPLAMELGKEGHPGTEGRRRRSSS